MRLLAISGSLRAVSSNTAALEALRLLAPAGVEVVLYRRLADLPHFNPDLDGEPPPEPVADLRREIGLCDGLVICSPEYAHGVAGTMKNALDWLVPSLEFPEKPVALINASPRATIALSHLRETLTVMTARIVEDASIAVPLQGRGLTPAQITADPELSAALRAALDAFVAAIDAQ
ncbi:MAG TPA: NADPH-dependent FMN reductase [Caulobacteraceae bacterium]|nr:NADPH-dependent FMN reductase [Caulobacteraceae bacterium]